MFALADQQTSPISGRQSTPVQSNITLAHLPFSLSQTITVDKEAMCSEEELFCLVVFIYKTLIMIWYASLGRS